MQNYFKLFLIIISSYGVFFYSTGCHSFNQIQSSLINQLTPIDHSFLKLKGGVGRSFLFGRAGPGSTRGILGLTGRGKPNTASQANGPVNTGSNSSSGLTTGIGRGIFGNSRGLGSSVSLARRLNKSMTRNSGTFVTTKVSTPATVFPSSFRNPSGGSPSGIPFRTHQFFSFFAKPTPVGGVNSVPPQHSSSSSSSSSFAGSGKQRYPGFETRPYYTGPFHDPNGINKPLIRPPGCISAPCPNNPQGQHFIKPGSGGRKRCHYCD